MASIKKRWFKDYILGMLLILLFLNIVFVVAIKNYYYSSIKQILLNKSIASTEFFNKYVNDSEPLNIVLKNYVEDYCFDGNFQVQLLDSKGRIISDSKGINEGFYIKDDFLSILNGEINNYVFTDELTNEKLMSVCAAIKKDDKIVGVLRFITSLERVDERIKFLITISLVITSAVILTLSLLSILFTKSILEPVNEINAVAKRMAKGQFNVKIPKIYNDEIGELADTMNYMADEILKMQNLKNEFISSISHELRTPLTSIKGWSETILLDNLDDGDEIKMGLKIISKEVERLSRMVDNLLDFSKLESGKINLNQEFFDLNDTINEIWCFYKAKAKSKMLNCSIEIDENIRQIYGDKYRFKQILINLLDNAIKFSKANGKILVKVFNDEDIKIIVQDDGIGIPSDKIEKVKEKFYKIDVKKEGSGLGLAICQELISLHGWSMDIESSEGLGTKIIISIAKQY